MSHGITIDTDGLIYYYTYRVSDANEHVMYDMNDFLLRHANETSYKEWQKALNNAVVYKKMSARWQVLGTLVFDFEVTEERFGGVSMFIPLSDMPIHPLSIMRVSRKWRGIRRWAGRNLTGEPLPSPWKYDAPPFPESQR